MLQLFMPLFLSMALGGILFFLDVFLGFHFRVSFSRGWWPSLFASQLPKFSSSSTKMRRMPFVYSGKNCKQKLLDVLLAPAGLVRQFQEQKEFQYTKRSSSSRFFLATFDGSIVYEGRKE